MSYCCECGCKLEFKELKNEGMIPFCKSCNAYRFEKYNVAVSMVVVNLHKDKVLLIKQYGMDRYILVAGYVNKGESAEETCVRELSEEVGLEAQKLIFQKSKYYAKSNTLMLNYIVIIKNENVKTNEEIDDYSWFSIEEGKQKIAGGSLAEEFYLQFYEKVKNHEI